MEPRNIVFCIGAQVTSVAELTAQLNQCDDRASSENLCLSMPHAEERAHQGHPDFRVAGKIFGTLWPDQSKAVVKLPVADQTALVQMDPSAFSLNAWSHQGATDVHLKHLSAARFRALVEAAWRNVTPKRMVAEHARTPS